MIRLLGPTSRLCDGLSRRELLRIGGLSLGGLSLDRLLGRPSMASETSRSFGKAKNCIVLFLSGGASHHDTFDPKPDAPAEIRGEFDTIATALPSIRFTKYLPETAKLMSRIALVRSMTHTSSGHATGGYTMFTGQTYAKTESEANFMGRQEAPHIGSAMAKISPGTGPMFPFILVPRRLDAGSGRRAGQWGGSLGSKYDPMQTGGDPNRDDFRLENLPLLANAPRPVLQRRLGLLDQLNQQTRYLKQSAPALALKQNQEKALDVIGSEVVRRAVDLATADPDLRARYGRNLFGQSVLLGRRLLDAGTRLVQVNWLRTQGAKGYAWDSHRENFEAMRDDLIPPFDRAFSALMTDLESTGQLDETLVVVATEFGRTPKVTLATGGRDHWPNVFSVLLAGGGIQGGQVYGASDRIGAYPAEAPVTPGDLMATICHCLGVDPHSEIHDQVDRPMTLCKGNMIPQLLI
ncbi:MAG TPA: DUF1501 domain-containing protein [Isosphaeraceae bacterium]|nr:DUF1501 domain-containing protein [Isosphaeraceae bacterium]